MNLYLKKSVGKTLKQVRKRHRYIQKIVADYIGVSRTTYSNMECGRQIISIDHILKLSVLYNEPIHRFFLFHPSAITYDKMIKNLIDENQILKDTLSVMEEKLRGIEEKKRKV
jgi:transcriptional regulator with XRE-family HTH domain